MRIRSGRPSRATAFALVVILVFLVLITTLVLAFFSSVTTDLSVAKSYAGGANSRQLAYSAVQLVMGQIRLGSGTNTKTAWASQPGMIRTYDDTGNAKAYYKLYSSDDMVVSEAQIGSFSFLEDDFKIDGAGSPSDWFEKPAIFTDLNAPIVEGAKEIYPIVDPGAETGIPSFKVRRGEETPIRGSSNPIPMPVKWIYVLQDGTLTTPTSVDGSGKIAGWSGSAVAPSALNPIIGRIAFWTDDETCKINVNTASEGVYADSPRLGALSLDDANLRNNQPVNKEYQRYPGHPAMTSLSAVFPTLTRDEIYDMVSRVGAGGSRGGTVSTVLNAVAPMVLEQNRLYASVDELLFKPAPDGGKRAEHNAGVNPTCVEKAKFFLTATSRAPELNLFGKPRISIWPISVANDADHRSTYDQLIAFCSTINGRAYYFQRSDPQSSTADLPLAPSDSGLHRNRKLLEYLRNITDRNIPGFGGSLGAKYNMGDAAGIAGGTERDQILMEIFDYIRCTNLADVNVTGKFTPHGQVVPIEDVANGTRGFGRFRTVQGANLLFICTGDNSSDSSIPANHRRIQAMFLPQLYDVSVGSIFNSKPFTVSIEGLDKFQWNNGSGAQSMGFPAAITVTMPVKTNAAGAGVYYDQASFGDQLGFRQFVEDCFGELQSATLDVPGSPGTFAFTGGTATFKFYDKAGGNIVQTVDVQFPPQDFPSPVFSPTPVKARNGSSADTIRTFAARKNLKSNGKEIENHDHWTTKYDVIRGVTCSHGDIRLIAARKNVPGSSNPAYPFAPNPKYADTTSADQTAGAHNLWTGDGYPYSGVYAGKLVRNAPFSTSYSQVTPDVLFNGVALGKKTAISGTDLPGDWDTGIAEMRDGPQINKPDEGDYGRKSGNTVLAYPYKWKYETGQFALPSSVFAPNRLVASAGMFGSLPTGVLSDRPWQTLLFRPGPAGHPGLGAPTPATPPYTTPPDHLFLDLFHMPVVEPYAISEPLSTAGKINMNYQIAPFTYIGRDTGLRAVLKSEKVISILTSNAGIYKIKDAGSSVPASGMSRQEVNVDATLASFEQRFESGDLFRAASEICDIDIVPSDYTGPIPVTRQSMDTYWSTRLLTGDNCRERPYATIYPRLTTKSNTYTVHLRVQTLKKVKGTSHATWEEGRDMITSEYRGSETIERYVDAADMRLPDSADPMIYNSADPAVNRSLEEFYRFRVIASTRFVP